MKEASRTIHINNHLLMQEITRMFNEQNKESVTFIVRGYSMRPFLEDRRDKVVLAAPRVPVIGDVVLVLKYAAGMTNLDDVQLIAADCNYNGVVNTADAVMILKYAAGMIEF